MTRPNAKISFGLSLALWFVVIFAAAMFAPDSMLAWQMWTGTSLFCLALFAVGWAALTHGEARNVAALNRLQHELSAARYEAEIAKAKSEARQHRLAAAQASKSIRETGRAHNTPNRQRIIEVQTWYINILGRAHEDGRGVGFASLRQYFTGTREERLAHWQQWIAGPFAHADCRWIETVQERKPVTLLISLDYIRGRIEAGDLPPHPSTPLPRMNWNGEQNQPEPAQTSANQPVTAFARDV